MSSAAAAIAAPRGTLYYRHTLPVRVMHWINVLALTLLFMSGLNIFNAHPTLNWGKSSYEGKPAVLEIGALQQPDGELIGITRIFGRQFATTGFLGASKDRSGEMMARAFPWWLTVPDNQWLAMARRWHLFFAWVFVINGLCYVAYSAAEPSPGSATWRLPRPQLRTVPQSIRRPPSSSSNPTGEAAKRYNVLQKLAYLAVIFVLLPLVILMGFAMSPGIDAFWPGWVDVFGGRQAARTIHFIVAWLLVGFRTRAVVFEVIVSGFWNHMRSMITGRYRVDVEETPMKQSA